MKRFETWLAAALCRARGLGLGDRGAVSPLFVLALIPLIGALGLAMESSNWYLQQRAMQNAADSAAIAAANNGGTTLATTCTGVTGTPGTFDCEAKAAAAKAGFAVGGPRSVVVTPTYFTTGCPGGSTGCYKVAISERLPLSLVQVIGYRGSPANQTPLVQTVLASAVARTRGATANYCIITLATGNSFRLNGAPNAALPNCSVFSNGNLVCNGNDLSTPPPGSPFGDAVGTSQCGITKRGGQPSITDPKAALDANPPIPANPCATYPQNSGAAITGANVVTSATNFSSPVRICGNARLGSSTINVTTPNAVLVIYNGSLDMFGDTIQTTGSGGLTIIFSGDGAHNGGSITYSHIPIDTAGGGVIDIAAPTSGTLSGVAILQDSRESGNKDTVDITYKGNNPTLKLQGLLYMPNSNLDFRGAIDLHSSGLSCIGIITKTLLVDGTASLLNNFPPSGVTSQCVAAGLILPGVPGTEPRPALVQ